LAILAIVALTARGDARDRKVTGEPVGRGSSECANIRAYLDDPAARGRTVHAAPAASAAVLGRIEPPLKVDERAWPAAFDLKAARGGWLLIKGAGDDPALTGGVGRTMYGGEGWIRGDGVSVGVQASQGFAEPRHSSAMTLQVLDGTDLGHVGEIVAIDACRGAWVRATWRIHDPAKIRYHRDALRSRRPLLVRAWSTGICNIQETSCDMPNGDRPR
jgi:hypothetical protein